MRKIYTSEEKQKKESRNKTIIGLVLVFLMVFSIAGFAFFNNQLNNQKDNSNVIVYNDIEFVKKNNGFWYSVIDNYEIITEYNPIETENIVVPLMLSRYQYTDKVLYFVSQNPKVSEEIARNMGYFVSRMQDACLKGKNCSGDLPEKNCTNNLIIIEEMNETKVTQEDNCILINAPYSNLTMAADAFIFQVLGIRRI